MLTLPRSRVHNGRSRGMLAQMMVITSSDADQITRLTVSAAVNCQQRLNSKLEAGCKHTVAIVTTR